jgi:hypothetical protein
MRERIPAPASDGHAAAGPSRAVATLARARDGDATTRVTAARRLRATLLRTPLVLAAALAAGIALRALAMASYRPAALVHFDSIAYLDAARTGLFDDPIHPAGYAAFLRAATAFGDRLWPAIALQHALGVGAALLVYAAVRRGGGGVRAGAAAAAVPLLAGDVVFLEHAVMSEALFVPLIAATGYGLVRAIGSDGRRRLAWLAAAGALVAAAALVRSVGLSLLPVLAVVAAVAAPATGADRDGVPAGRGLRALAPRLASAAVLLAAAGAVVGGYLVAQGALSDRPGFTEVGGWAVYGRAAPFADCREFDPPPGTEPLCERTPPDERPGGDFYAWVGGPARAAFGAPPRGDEQVGAFARAAIRAQPGDYLRAVATDLARYVDPDAGRERPYNGDPPEQVSFARREPDAQAASERALARHLAPAEVERTAALSVLEGWGRVVRLHGLLLVALLALAVAGALAGRGRARAPAAVLALVGLTLLAAPALTGLYNARYAVPAAGPLVAAGALGASALATRRRATRGLRP